MQFSEDLLQLISKMLNIPMQELKYEKDEEIGGYYFKSTKLGKTGANMLVDENGNYKMIFSRNSKECIEQFRNGKRDGKFDIMSAEKKNLEITYEKAYKYAVKHFGTDKIKCLENEKEWIFCNDSIPNNINMSSGIAINKETGKVKSFVVPDTKKYEVSSEPTQNQISGRKEDTDSKEEIDNSKLMETINNLATRNDDFIHKQLMRRIRMAKFLMATSESDGKNLIFAYKDEEKVLLLAFTSYQEFNKWNNEQGHKNYKITECKFKDFTKVILDCPAAYSGILIDPNGVNFKIDMNFLNEILMDAPGAKDNKTKIVTRDDVTKRNNEIRNMTNTNNIKTENKEIINSNINEQYSGLSGLISVNNMYL